MLTVAVLTLVFGALIAPPVAAEQISPECRDAFEQGALAGHECETQLREGKTPQNESPQEELPTICIISPSQPFRAYCHQESAQERQLEKAGKVVDDVICLATMWADPSCALPWPSPGAYRVEHPAGGSSITYDPSGDPGNVA